MKARSGKSAAACGSFGTRDVSRPAVLAAFSTEMRIFAGTSDTTILIDEIMISREMSRDYDSAQSAGNGSLE
jgi:hypothetical protein